MVIKISPWKAPWIRIFLVAGAFLLFTSRSLGQYNYDANCRQAYEAILSLRFREANQLIFLEKKAEPRNLLPVYLENYIDFLTLIIGEDRDAYERLKANKGKRLKALEKGRDDSPFYNFCLGEVYLQWALARLKFGDYTAAALEIRKAHTLFLANETRYPSFLLNKMGMGVVHVMVSLVPDNYKWLSSLIGLDGSMENGLNEIRLVAEYSGKDITTKMYKPQATFFLAFLTLNLQKNKRDALPYLELLKNQSPDEPQSKSPLMIYARATILMRNGLNDEALSVLQERVHLSQTFPFYYLDYLEGMARLNKLDYSASAFFEQFLAGFRGRSYIRSTHQKLAWIALLKGDSANYYRLVKQPVSRSSGVDEDKQAGNEAGNNTPPNVTLLRARLLFDGGYYNLAISELLNNSVKTTVKSKRDLVEYTYRLGRIYHETGNFDKAIENYHQTVSRGKTEPYYFAAGAAYQLGLLYENRGSYVKADSAYHLCLSIDTPEYRTSLHQKAKAGLTRLKTLQPKT